MTLAVYRSVAPYNPQPYFIAPAGLQPLEAIERRVSDYYPDQITALAVLIETQHDVNRSTEETGR